MEKIRIAPRRESGIGRGSEVTPRTAAGTVSFDDLGRALISGRRVEVDRESIDIELRPHMGNCISN